MELKEARALVASLKGWQETGQLPTLNEALITLDNRITELEAEMKQILNEFDEVEAKVKTLTQTIRRKEANLNAIEHLNRAKGDDK